MSSLTFSVLLLSCTLLTACSIVGYGLGSAAGAARRHSVSVAEIGPLWVGRYAWLELHSGEKLNGRIEALFLPDSLLLRPERASSDPIPGFYPRSLRSVPLSAVASIKVSQSTYRWFGLGLGAAVDLTVIYYVLTLDTAFHPARAKAGTP